MSDTVKIQHPILQELNFPRKNLITLDISTFNTDSASECYMAIQKALGCRKPEMKCGDD